MNTPQPLLELAKAATKGPWLDVPDPNSSERGGNSDTLTDICDSSFQVVASTSTSDCTRRDWEPGEEEANAQLIARLNPAVAVRVYEALQDFFEAVVCHHGEDSDEHKEMVAVLSLLDGETTEEKS